MSKEYLAKRLLPLYDRVMALFDNVDGKSHQYAMGNLYNSAIFFKAAYNDEEKLLSRGVMRKGIRGILSCIKIE